MPWTELLLSPQGKALEAASKRGPMDSLFMFSKFGGGRGVVVTAHPSCFISHLILLWKELEDLFSLSLRNNPYPQNPWSISWRTTSGLFPFAPARAGASQEASPPNFQKYRKKEGEPKISACCSHIKTVICPDSAVLSRDASVEQADDSADRSIGLGKLPPQVYPLRLPEEFPSLLFAWLAIMFLLQALVTRFQLHKL